MYGISITNKVYSKIAYKHCICVIRVYLFLNYFLDALDRVRRKTLWLVIFRVMNEPKLKK